MNEINEVWAQFPLSLSLIFMVNISIVSIN